MAPNRLDKTEYPFAAHYFEINGQQLHYIDEGKGDVLLFVHGTPSWSFDSRNVIRELSSGYRCIAIDHIGFGLSSKPAKYDYSTLNHSRSLQRFITEKKLENITLILHDFGGPIGFHTALVNPSNIKRIVFLNSWLWSSTNDPDFKKMARILRSPLLPFLYRYLNFSPRYILPRSFGELKLSRKLRKQYTLPFTNPNQRNGALAFVRSLLKDQEWFESLWNERHKLHSIPVLLIWGMSDPVIPPRYLEKFRSGFPGADVIKLERCGHFPQEEEPDRVARAIQDWLDQAC